MKIIKLKTCLVLVLIMFFFFSTSCRKFKDQSIFNNYLKNENNIIIYNNKIPENDIKEFSLNYNSIIGKLLKENNIIAGDINKQNIFIIIINDDLKELDQFSDRILNKIKKKKKNINISFNSSDIKKLYYNFYLYNYQPMGLFDGINDVIVLKYNKKYDNKSSFFLNMILVLLGEYNHFLIKQNLIRNFPDYINIIKNSIYDNEINKIKNFFDEPITHFYYYYFSTFFKANLIYDIDKLSEIKTSFDSYHILGFYNQCIDLYKKNKDIKELNSFFYGNFGIGSDSMNSYFLSLFVMLTEKYGSGIINKLINFLYIGKFNCFNDIIHTLFNMDEEEFYRMWEEYTLIKR